MKQFVRNYWHLIATIICVIFASAYRGAEDIRLFAYDGNIFYEMNVTNGTSETEIFYRGDNKKFNPSLPWTADFWHRMKHLEYIFWALALVFASKKWWMFVAYFLYGAIFVLFYHYFWKIVPDAPFWTVVGWILWPFKNFH